MTSTTIYTPDDEEVRLGLPLGRRLREFNYRHIGEYPESTPIWLNAKDAHGNAIGGIRGLVVMHWLRVEFLWVEEAFQRSGVGSMLLAEAEAQAGELGAKNVGVETFEWQAPDFYRKQGYTEVSRVDNYVGTYYLAFFRKVL
ncbi:N-acetyltransferase [Polaromonas sp. A23]|uniref:GNAT family N-acetyltransferase n=1 Tax=Polaromonas sp. A23 TaxID=1944133 RepID=UPI0009876940|nr:GNAT family N-acetyltransferase [Polaromonas sp. A23]OOG36540.1 GNAT family N-acetyltransferase [Polaromonas sp. A23]